ncbi:MAG: hypothetical protein Q8936_06740 [Bacillota bacterium]|nr:hypothetical protein [Bacillota bacterium]
MTIVFNKRLGIIKGIFSGELQTMDVLYGDEASDFKLIWDEVLLPDDENVLRNPGNFKINVDNYPNSVFLEILPQVNNYPVAASN